VTPAPESSTVPVRSGFREFFTNTLEIKAKTA